jgi:peptidyl-prolyl cis-trans isomerase B (cyclophilin B)
MIQGGGFTPDMQQKQTKRPIRNEADNGLQNDEGTVAMARTNAAHSATSQFFINVTRNSFLDHQSQANFGYCVFGRVIEGLDVVKQIEGVQTGRHGRYDDVPLEPIVIQSATVVAAAEPADG